MKKYTQVMIVVSALIVLSVLGLGPAPSRVEAAVREGETIAAIDIQNNKAISRETIVSKMKTKPGEPFHQDVLSDDLKRLYATDYFADVSIETEETPDGVKVIIVVEEKPIIDSVLFEGNKAFREDKLKKTMRSKAGDVLSYSLLAQDMGELKKLYEKKGFVLVEVRYQLDIDKETNKVIVHVLVDEKTRVKISRIDVVGNTVAKTKDLRRLLATKPAWLFNRGIFEESTFEGDLEKMREYYRHLGFLDVVVEPRLDYSQDGTQLVITIAITEGRQYFVGDLKIQGQLVFPENDVRAVMKLKTGSAFSDRTLREDYFNIERFYYRYGYMNVQVDVARELDSATGTIALTYTIDPKDIVFIRKINIQGNSKTKDIVIRRELRVFPGEKFSGDKIQRSKERLYNLGFFEDISFQNQPTANPREQDLIVDVKETKTGEFSFGAGYSSIDEFIGFIEVRQRNFDILNFPSFMGAGQDLAIKAELGTVRRDYLLSWTEPWIFGYPYSFGFDIFQTTHSRRSGYYYEETRTGGDLRLGKEFNDYLRADLTYQVQRVDISDLSDTASPDLREEEGQNWISGMVFEMTRDTRDNKFNPKRGYVLNGAVEPYGGPFGGDKDFYKIMGTGKYYQPVSTFAVIEFKLRAGIADAYSDSHEVPVYERFYAGGANTIRGYEERRVSPRDSGSNDPIGGESMIIGNIEGVVPIYQEIIKGALFYDVGNTWRRWDEIGSGQFRSGTGVGLRIKTPIGPVKLDYGFPLNDNYGDKKQGQFYFSISHGF